MGTVTEIDTEHWAQDIIEKLKGEEKHLPRDEDSDTSQQQSHPQS